MMGDPGKTPVAPPGLWLLFCPMPPEAPTFNHHACLSRCTGKLHTGNKPADKVTSNKTDDIYVGNIPSAAENLQALHS